MSRRVLHQFLTGATLGDAISDQALIIQRWLHELGFESRIYAQYIHASVAPKITALLEYRRSAGEKWAIYHHSIGSDLPDFLSKANLKLLLIYHNITPAEFFAGSDPSRMEIAQQGRRQLLTLRDRSELGLADSSYNARELVEAGFTQVAVLPITLFPQWYNTPGNQDLALQLRQTGPNLLFVGRLAPNKKQEDLIKLLYVYRRLQPGAHLYLVGDRWELGYDKWVEDLADDLDLAGSVTLSGKVSQQDLVTYYKGADFYVSMSEHEGFGLPIIESMFLGLPVLAYGVTAVPETMGDAGILFFKKDYEGLAELLEILRDDQALRERILARQKKRAQNFLEPQVRNQFEFYLRKIGALD